MTQLQAHNPTTRELGYRMPAEFEPVSAVWVVPPHRERSWPHCLAKAQWEHEIMCQAIRAPGGAPVRDVTHLGVRTDDSWVRDFGPIFVVKDPAPDATTDPATLACHDFVFTGWGNKYGPRPLDDAVPAALAQHLNITRHTHNMVLEGGSIDVNGQGTVLTTEQCLLHPNRNPALSRDQIAQALHDALGTSHLIWLPGGILGDDTDGHVDDVARFVNPHTVLAVRAPSDHPDHDLLERNWKTLEKSRDQDGRRLDLLPLPAPKPLFWQFPGDEFTAPGRRQLPASYANFLIVNRVVVVPIFDQPSDDQALRRLEEALPSRTVVGVPARHLVVGLGAVHCLTLQQPEV